MKITIYGASSPRIDSEIVEKVEDLGYKCAKKGHSLIFGGGSSGCMGAAARGFKKGNGHIRAYIPSFFEQNGYKAIFYDANELIRTKDMAERKSNMENDCDAFIITPGGVGTFEEFFQCLSLKQLSRHNKPIVLFNIKGYWNTLETLLKESMQKGFMTEKCLSLYKIIDNAEDILSYLENYNEPPASWNDLKIGGNENK